MSTFHMAGGSMQNQAKEPVIIDSNIVDTSKFASTLPDRFGTETRPVEHGVASHELITISEPNQQSNYSTFL